MAYIDYTTYSKISFDAMEESEFDKYLPWAEKKLDDWTYNRLKGEADVSSDVKMALVVLIDGMKSIKEARKALASGNEVSSYSNGVSSFSFRNPFGGTYTPSEFEETENKSLYWQIVEMLPSYLVSSVVERPNCAC